MRLQDLTTPLPREVRETYDEILKGTGQEPDINRRDNGRRYRMTVENARIRMQVDYKLTGRRWVWAASQLYIDGVQRPIMPSPQAFFRLWHDPDGDGYRRADPVDDPVLEPYPLEDAPPELRTFVQHLRDRLDGLADSDGSGVTLTFGRVGEAPVLRMTRAGSVLSVWMKQTGPAWFPYAVRLVVDGYDRTPAAGTTFDGLLAEFLGDRTGPGLAPAGGPLVHAARPAQRNTSVEVRKQSVMRI